MLLRTAALVFIGALALVAQHSTTQSNPFNSPADIVAGTRLYRIQCAACHGPVGAGGAVGPDLTTGSFRRGDSDQAIFDVVAKGIPGTVMPPFPGSGRDVWQIVAYVRTLSVGNAAGKAKGDAAKGAALFDKQGCRNCHTLGDSGGDGGPDLSRVGAMRSLGSLRRSVTNPNAEVSRDFWQLRARTKSGQNIGGVRLNEDTFSFQYRARSGLASVLKSDLAEHEIVKTSAMPSYADKLSAAELDDLVAFLANQRSGGAR